MKFTEKDSEFVARLRALLNEKELHIELRQDGFRRFVLRQNYGDKICKHFGMTRQGVRWRFQRLFNDIYVSAFETILFIERIFGAQLREHAIRISKERYELRQEAMGRGFQSADLLKPTGEGDRKAGQGEPGAEEQ